MRGVIESFDSATGIGTIRAKDGTLYPFARANLVRRSKPPHAFARVVFRLKDGKIFCCRRARPTPAGLGLGRAFWPLGGCSIYLVILHGCSEEIPTRVKDRCCMQH